MLHDLAGWDVRGVCSGGTSTVAAASASLIGWGPAPTSGEMGFGEATKSSTKPKLVDDLEGCHVITVRARAGRACRGRLSRFVRVADVSLLQCCCGRPAPAAFAAFAHSAASLILPSASTSLHCAFAYRLTATL